MDILGGRTASVGAAASPSYPSPRVMTPPNCLKHCSGIASSVSASDVLIIYLVSGDVKERGLRTYVLPQGPCMRTVLMWNWEVNAEGATQAREELVLFPLMPEGHLNYAATWLTLSACIGTAGLMAMRKQRRLPIK